MAVTANINLSVTGEHTELYDTGSKSARFGVSVPIPLTSGTGASQADRVFTDTRTLGASATEDLDLAGGLTDAFGASLTFAKIKAVIITAAPGNTNDVNFSRPAANGVPLFAAASDLISIKPGGFFAWGLPGTGVTVTAATGDLITFTNSGAGTSVTYTVVIIGTSA